MLKFLLTAPWLLASALGSSLTLPTHSIVGVAFQDTRLYENPAFALALLPGLSAPTPPLSSASSPDVNVHYHYYSVQGDTIAALQAQMNRLGPATTDEHFAANTDWHVRWSFESTAIPNGCKITSVTSDVDVVFTLPQWQTPKDASFSLVDAWDQFIAALQIHENGHMAHGVAASADITRTLSQLPVYSSCQQLEAAANSAARHIVRYYNRRDVDYDRDTQHGLVQGAVFPPAQPSASRSTDAISATRQE